MEKPEIQVIRFDNSILTILTPSGRECSYYCNPDCGVVGGGCSIVCLGDIPGD